MKKISIVLLCTLLLLTSCLPNRNDDEVLQNDETETKTSIVPSHRLSEEEYRIVLPYETSKARGVIVNQVANRVDIYEMEEGLRRHSKEVFNPDELYFQEGQYLTEDMVFDMITEMNPKIDRDKTEDMDLEEAADVFRDNPRYLSHILEQNYLKPGEDNVVELAGVSIGIALKSVYRFQPQIGSPYFEEEIPFQEMMEQGKEIAQKVLEQLRSIEGLTNVPVFIALYREESQASPVPGNYVAKTLVPAGDFSIKDWESINEEYVLFPSDEGKEKYLEDHEIITSFGSEIASFFPNYVGVVGEGFYIDEELQTLTIEIPIEFNGSAEIVGFTQYVYGLIQDMFPNYYDLEVRVTSSEKIESLLTRDAGEDEVNVHILH